MDRTTVDAFSGGRSPLPVLLAFVLVLAGCTGSLARVIVEPSVGDDLSGAGLRTGGDQLTELRERMTWVMNAEIMRARGADGTELFAFVLEPGDYGLAWDSRWERGEFRFRFSFDTGNLERDAPGPPRGTMVLLHGMYGGILQLLPQALHFAERGYRVVLVDLRAHGQSGGRYVTFGVREREDLAALVDALRARDRVVRPLVLYGTSLGAAVALQGAATGVTVDRIVAIAAMADAREVVAGSGPEMVPGWLRWLISAERLEAAMERAQRMAGFTWKDASTVTRAPEVAVPVLLVHAREDGIVPFEHAERLREALSCSTLRPVDRHGHASLMMDPRATVGLALSWLAEERPCPREEPGSGDGQPSTSSSAR